MGKRKAFNVDDDDVNDGSDSDDSEPNYQSRAGLRGVHHIPDESLTVTGDGRTRAKLTSVATPASPAKKSQISLNTDIHVPREPEQPPQKEWQANYSEFDAEYGPGLNKGPREQRGSDYPNEQWAWLNHVEFLDELVRHDGRGDYMDQVGCAGKAVGPQSRHFAAPIAFTPVCIARAASSSSTNGLHFITSRSGMGFSSNPGASKLSMFGFSWDIRQAKTVADAPVPCDGYKLSVCGDIRLSRPLRPFVAGLEMLGI
ncbi:hypothetical protein B0H10DRAFT_1950861 [Mycena sp. CBHHK59/15]|nr:hypothetical protein B0H10DRAFT_1950861 [Mycena sp. CBHHK59/15]